MKSSQEMTWLAQELEQIKKQHLYRQPRVLGTGQTPHTLIDGRELLMLSSNNYLGLSEHPAVKQAAIGAVQKYGTGSGGSRLTTGTTDLYAELEESLASFKDAERSLVFSTGYMANIACLSSLPGKNDVIFSDELNHASIIDGCRLSRAGVRIYRHRDTGHLRELLRESSQSRRRLIVTDGVFSMDGDLAPLPEIVELSEEFDAMVMVDDAHATGTLGVKRRGTGEYFKVHDKIDIHMGTLSKAIGSMGGYVAGKSELIEYLVNTARPFIFSTALPPASIGASLKAIKVIQQDDPAKQLWRNVNEYTTRLKKGGLPVETESQIIPIITGSEEKTIAFSERLFETGIFATAIRPPSVPEDTCRIRTTLMATHTKDDISLAADIILGTAGEHDLI